AGGGRGGGVGGGGRTGPVVGEWRAPAGEAPAGCDGSIPGVGRGVSNKNLVLAAMVFAVAMIFIDQTIVAIAIPNLRKELSLSASGAQWIINGYLLALAALFAFGGKLADVVGRRRMVVIGVIGFAITSALCGATPKGSVAETWIIVFRVLQGAF